MDMNQDLLLLKDYVLKTYQQEMEYVISTAVEAELRGLLVNSLEKSEFYKGQQSCLEQILDEYRAISDEKPEAVLDFTGEKGLLWKTYLVHVSDQSEAYQQGYKQRLESCYSLIEGVQGFLKDGRTMVEYVNIIEAADRFAVNKLSHLLRDMGITMDELSQYQVPFWKEYVSVYCSNMREIYFAYPEIESNPMPIFQKEIQRLKGRSKEAAISKFVEEKFQNIVGETSNLVNYLNKNQ